MKNSIKLSALFLLFSTGLFAAVPVKLTHTKAVTKASSINNMVTFATLPSKRGVEVKVDPNAPGKAVVIIYNYENDVVWKDVLKPNKSMDKGYILSFLDNGNYTVQVILDNQKVQKTAHVYYKGDTKFVSLRG